VVGGLIGGLIGVAFVVVGTRIDPNAFRMGGGNDTGGMAVLFFLSWGFVGLLLGVVVGVLGAIPIAIRQ
jgi:hypothetical protein